MTVAPSLLGSVLFVPLVMLRVGFGNNDTCTQQSNLAAAVALGPFCSKMRRSARDGENRPN